MLGFKVIARPDSGFVHYLPCEIKASEEMLESVLHANSTTLVDIVLRRIVRKNVFRVDRMTSGTKAVDFEKTKLGDEVVSEGNAFSWKTTDGDLIVECPRLP